MVQFTLKEIAVATNGTLIQGDPGQVVTGIITDTRRMKPGELFLALKGEQFDGHHFIDNAVTAGAIALVVMDLPALLPKNVAVIKVLDTLTALGDIARFHRRRLAPLVMGITGSNGKTTTKDLIASVLAEELSIIKTEANFNNEIGLPLTLLKIAPETKAVIVEMGMRGLGQIKRLTEIAEPTMGIITNVGLTHLELLGSQTNIAKAKAELVAALPENGLAVLNGDDPLVREMHSLTKARVVYYGIDNTGLDYQGVDLATGEDGSGFQVVFNHQRLKLSIPMPGRHNILNALAAVAIAKELGVSNQAIQRGLALPELTGKRLNILNHQGWRVIDDTYNASPTSVKAALDVLAASKTSSRKIAVLADMLELGPTSREIHREIGNYAGEIGIDRIFAFGELAEEFVMGVNSISQGKGEYFSNKPALISKLKDYLQPGDFILVKGSRGMKMEEIVAAITGEGDEK